MVAFGVHGPCRRADPQRPAAAESRSQRRRISARRAQCGRRPRRPRPSWPGRGARASGRGRAAALLQSGGGHARRGSAARDGSPESSAIRARQSCSAWDCSRLLEQGDGVLTSSLPPTKLREAHERPERPRRPGAGVVLDRGFEQCLCVGPSARASASHGAVLGSAEREHVPAAVAIGELRDAVAPGERNARGRSTAMHALTRKQQVHALEIGIDASPASAIAVASSRQSHALRRPRRMATSDAPSSARPSISRSGTANRRPSSAARTAFARAVSVSPTACAKYPSLKASQPCGGHGSSSSRSRWARRSQPLATASAPRKSSSSTASQIAICAAAAASPCSR